jgi:cell division protein FtsI (penicillin-binding protein 3)
VPGRAVGARPAYRTVPPPLRPVLRCVSPGRRLNITILVIAFVMSVFAARLVQLQGFEAAQLSAEAAQQSRWTISFPTVRGSIISSNGTMLAMTVQTDTVTADPVQIPASARPAVAAELAGPLGMPAVAVLHDLDDPSSPQFSKLRTQLSQPAASRIASMNLPGIDLVPTYSRVYPDGDLASDVVGFTNTDQKGDLVGQAGLEYEYNSLLAGRDGSEDVEVGTDNEPIPGTTGKVTPAVPAQSLRLTINSDIQYAALQECRERVMTYHARNCSIVVMNPHTGAILAMAQWPTYDPSDVTNLAATTNISTANVFAPGSTLKSITVAAALEKGGQTPMSAYTIPYQIQMDGEYTFHDAEWHPTVRYTIAGILAHSSNVGMVQVVTHITPMEQYDYLRAFGLGSPSGLGLPGESAGLVPRPGTPGYWGDEPFEFSFGQGVGVTAMQMASVYATIANGGVRVQPTLVAGTVSSTGAYIPAPAPPQRRVIQAKTASELMTILQQVPAVDAQAGELSGEIAGYTVAAKTGTAQVSDPSLSKCSLCQYGSSYIGIAPANDPQLVVAVNIQDPQGNDYFGDEVAGPAFNDVMRFALQTMKIPPDNARTPYIRLTAP